MYTPYGLYNPFNPYNPYGMQPQAAPQAPMAPVPMQRPSQSVMPPVQQSNPNTLSCEIVGDFETVKAAQLDMTGQPKYYPLSDGTTIYRKQLMADGTSKIFTYTLASEPKENASTDGSDAKVMEELMSINDKLASLASQVQQINQLWGGTGNE